METILQFSIIAIPIIIGVTKGLNEKLFELFGVDNKLQKEVVTLIVSILSVVFYVMYAGILPISLLITLVVVNYFGASGIYQFVKSKEDVIEQEYVEDQDEEEVE